MIWLILLFGAFCLFSDDSGDDCPYSDYQLGYLSDPEIGGNNKYRYYQSILDGRNERK